MDSFETRDAFRKHRHDVLNYMQLFKAYVQLGQPERALASVDQCANWLGSLSSLQTATTPLFDPLFWAATCCPHLTVRGHQLNEGLFSGSKSGVTQAADALVWLETAVSEHNMEGLTVTVKPTIDGQMLELDVETSKRLHGVVDDIVATVPTHLALVRWTCSVS